jgi:alpha-tubulin suppressor-like RCC1 family protein
LTNKTIIRGRMPLKPLADALWACGRNGAGQLGDGNPTMSRNTLVAVLNLSDISAIACGDSYSLALKTDGTVWAWGFDVGGQIGVDTKDFRNTPAQIKSLSDIIAIAAGCDHNLALKADGTVWAWGNNYAGQLGDGTKDNRTTPAEVKTLTGVIAIAAGREHNLALKAGGTVWAWGENQNGQLGDGTFVNRAIPAPVKYQGSDLKGVTAIAAGYKHSMAIGGDSRVLAWGGNDRAQLGEGDWTHKDSAVPLSVVGPLKGVAAIAAGKGQSLAIKTDGTVWGWGSISFGQAYDLCTAPKQLTPLTEVAAIAAGEYHTLVLKKDGTVWAWGDDNMGQLGNGKSGVWFAPAQVGGLKGVSMIAAGRWHSLFGVKGQQNVRSE